MKQRISSWIIAFASIFWAGGALAYDCSGLNEWRRQHFYLMDAQVQYEGTAYVNTAESSKRDRPDRGDPWSSLGVCESTGGGGGGGGGGGDPTGDVRTPFSIYGVWHCGNSYCDWSQERDMVEFAAANNWIVDRGDTDQTPSVNLVVLSFLKPVELLEQTNNEAFVNGVPRGMTPAIVNFFKSKGIAVLLSMGGVTYTDSWNEALVRNPAGLAARAAQAVIDLEVNGLEIDWENGTPDDAEKVGMEIFIDTYRQILPNAVLTLDLAVGSRYLQHLSRRAAEDWLPSGKIDYINAMVPRGEPDTDQWQEHVDGKSNYNPPIPPKPPAKIAVSMWLTDSRRSNANCVDFNASTQLDRSDYAQTVLPNGAGVTPGFLGYMFWAAECPSTRNVCTTPPNGCLGGTGVGATHFDIPIPLEFGNLRLE